MLSRLVLTLVLLLGAATAQAVAVDQPLDDPALEQRARAIHKQLRCLVCQNQSIEDSDADLARDLRVLVRQRIAAGDSDRETLDYVVARYGDWVLLKPPLKSGTVLLWAAPLLLLALALAVTVLWYRRRPARSAAAAPLSAAERQRLAELLDDQERT